MMQVDSDTHYAMRLWCIDNIPVTRKGYRQWRFDVPTEKKGKNRGKTCQYKHGEPYEFTPFFEKEMDAEAFAARWI